MKMMTIASGSSGNCTFVGTEKTSLLVDVGVSKKKIEDGLKKIDLSLKDMDGILITHEHIDHVRAVGVIARSTGIPLYATPETCCEISQMSALGEFDKSLLNPINVDELFNIGDIGVRAHSIWHDAVDPVCYSLYNGGKKVSIATDMGDYDDYIIEALKDSDGLLVEANHDIRMLECGSYPYNLKQRILGKRGHLSNEAGGRLLKALLNEHIKASFIGHLSKENNYPDLAYETVKLEIMDNPYTKDVRDFNLRVADREKTSELFEF